MIAASSTVFVIGPIWSNDEAKAIRPNLETLVYVGFSPTVPQKDDGCLIEPPVSLPKAAKQRLAATAVAAPPEEPPLTFDISFGF